MNGKLNLSGSAIQQVNNCLIVSLNSLADENSIRRTGQLLLELLKNNRAKGVVIDLSDVTIINSDESAILKNMAKAVAIMGTTPVFAGFQPGVAASLVDLDTGFDEIMTVRNINDAVELLTQ